MGKKCKVLPSIFVKSITMTCGACPSQWSGKTTTGRTVYIRYRYGHLSVSVGDVVVKSVNIGGSMDGVMSTHYMKQITGDVLDWSECNG